VLPRSSPVIGTVTLAALLVVPGILCFGRAGNASALQAVPGAAASTTPAESVGRAPSASGHTTQVQHTGADVRRASPSPDLMLVNQAPTMVTGGGPFVLELATGRGLPPASDLDLDASMYRMDNTRAAFQQILAESTPNAPYLGSTGAIRLSNLAVPGTTTAASTSTRYRLAVGLEAGNDMPTAPVDGSVIDLDCAPGDCTPNGGATGLYPLNVTLSVATTGRILARFTTFMTYSQAPAGTPLRVAVVLPLQATPGPRRALAQGVPAALSPSEAQSLAAVTAAIDKFPASDTLEPLPQTVQQLAASGRAGHAALTDLQAAAIESDHEVLAAPYSAVDPAELAASGLTGEITRQVQRGQRVMSTLGIPTVTGTWVAERGVAGGAAAAVSAMGAQRVVVPSSALVPENQQYTPSLPFQLSLGHGRQVLAAQADAGYTSLFTADPGNQALAAYQLLAELDLTYEEQPSILRGVVVAPPAGWQADATFVSTLLSALAPGAGADTDLQAVTVSTLFSTVPQPSYSSDQPSVRQPSSNDPAATLPASFVARVRRDRQRWTAFSSAVQGGGGTLGQLDDALLAAESSRLGARGRVIALSGFTRALGVQLSRLQFATDRTITLTSRTAALPVTILSSAPYRVVATLALASAKLQFPDGATRQVDIDRSTTPLRVQVEARTSGDLPVEMTLLSPSGGLVLGRAQLTVRSTATSLVGIVLSLVALAVLLGWWARTSLTRRRRRGAHTGQR
jgi:hypothetical protein